MSWNEFSKHPKCPCCGLNGAVYQVPDPLIGEAPKDPQFFCSRFSGGCGTKFTKSEAEAAKKLAS